MSSLLLEQANSMLSPGHVVRVHFVEHPYSIQSSFTLHLSCSLLLEQATSMFPGYVVRVHCDHVIFHPPSLTFTFLESES